MVARIDPEVDHQPRQHRQRAAGRERVDRERRDDSDKRQRERNAGEHDAARRLEAALHVGLLLVQDDVGEVHHRVGHARGEHGHVQEDVAVLHDGGQQKRDRAQNEQRDERRLARAGDGQELRQVTRAGQRERLTRAAEHGGEERCDQAGQPGVIDEHRERPLADLVEGLDQRCGCAAGELGARAAGREEQDERARHHQHQHRADDALRHVALRVGGFLGRQRHALDREEQPDAERQRREHAGDAEGQKRRTPFDRRGHVEQVGHLEVRRDAEEERDERDDRDGCDAEDDLERLADADEVDADEHDEERGDDGRGGHVGEQPELMHVSGDERRDGRRADRVFDQDGEAGQRAADLAHRAPREAIARARRRHRRRHLGESQHHEQIHRTHYQKRDEHPEPSAIADAVVPSREVARDDVGDAQAHEQNPAHSALLQGPFLEVFL